MEASERLDTRLSNNFNLQRAVNVGEVVPRSCWFESFPCENPPKMMRPPDRDGVRS